MQFRKKPERIHGIQDLDGIWTRDLAYKFTDSSKQACIFQSSEFSVVSCETFYRGLFKNIIIPAVTDIFSVVCVASVSVWFRSKERRTIKSQRRVKERKEDGSRSSFPAAKTERNICVSWL